MFPVQAASVRRNSTNCRVSHARSGTIAPAAERPNLFTFSESGTIHCGQNYTALKCRDANNIESDVLHACCEHPDLANYYPRIQNDATHKQFGQCVCADPGPL